MRTILGTALLCGLIAYLLAGCDGLLTPDPIKTKPSDAQALVDHIVYVKAKNGICFGVVSVDRLSTGGHLAENQMLVTVDCEKVGL